MNRPVVLWNPVSSTTSDDAGTTIIKSVLPPPVEPGPYEDIEGYSQRFRYVPSLAYFAIRKLVEYPDLIDIGSARIYYEKKSSSLEYDILRALLPGFGAPDATFSLSQVDPRLWAVIVQVFVNLPTTLRSYPIPLSDKHLPLLQRIPSTAQFCLITVLDIQGCRELTDNTILELKVLHSLCALDASSTPLSGLGLRRLSGTLLRDDDGQNDATRGPWRLRILRLRDCKKVDNTIFGSISAFPLLCVVDLRGTKCIPNSSVPDVFSPASKREFYHPIPISRSLKLLASYCNTLFSVPEPYTLHITSLHHKRRVRTVERHPPALSMQDDDRSNLDEGEQTLDDRSNESSESDERSNHNLTNNSYDENEEGYGSSLPRHDIETGQDSIDVPMNTTSSSVSFRSWFNSGFGSLPIDSPSGYLSNSNPHPLTTATGPPAFSGNCPTSPTTLEGQDSTASVSARSHLTQTNDSTTMHTIVVPGSQESRTTGESLLPNPELQANNSTILDRNPLLASLHDGTPGSSNSKSGNANNILKTQTSLKRTEVTGRTKRRRTHSPMGHVWNALSVVQNADMESSSQLDMDIQQQASRSGMFPLINQVSPEPANSNLGRGSLRESLQSAATGLSTAAISMPLSPERGDPQGSSRRDIRPRMGDSSPNQPTALAASMPFELQNAIAETEAHEHDSREAARAFYSVPANEKDHLARARKTLQSSKRTPIHDELLMLYRDPPAWSTLDTWKPNSSSRTNGRDRNMEMAILNRANAKGKEGMQALTEMINRKKKMQRVEEQFVNSVMISESRNPFRSKSKPVVKPLVSVSALTVPVLPREIWEKTTADEGSDRNRKLSRSTQMTGVDDKPVKSRHLFIAAPKKMLPQNKEGCDAVKPRRKPFAQSSKPGKTGELSNSDRVNGKSPAAKEEDKSTSKGKFDWQAWSKR